MTRLETLTIVRPKHDTITEWGHWHQGEFVKFAHEHQMTLIDLQAWQARKDLVQKVLFGLESCHFYGSGHGDATTYTGQDKEVILEVGVNTDWGKDRVLHLLSCSTAVALGRELVEKGAKAYAGYVIDWATWIDTGKHPSNDPLSFGNFDSDAEFDRAMVNGKTVEQAYEACKAKYNEYIELWQTAPPVPEMQDEVLVTLTENRDGLVYYGDPNAKITRPSLAPFLAFLGLVLFPFSVMWFLGGSS